MESSLVRHRVSYHRQIETCDSHRLFLHLILWRLPRLFQIIIISSALTHRSVSHPAHSNSIHFKRNLTFGTSGFIRAFTSVFWIISTSILVDLSFFLIPLSYCNAIGRCSPARYITLRHCCCCCCCCCYFLLQLFSFSSLYGSLIQYSALSHKHKGQQLAGELDVAAADTSVTSTALPKPPPPTPSYFCSPTVYTLSLYL